LYYLPIILASLRLGRPAGLGAAIVAMLLYHVANLSRFMSGYSDADVVQTILFVVVGIVTAKLSADARRLRQLATTDDLTGLHNLRSFEARLERMIRTSRETRTPLSMLALDVDRLKSINDTYGHLTGAEAVRLVGHTLPAQLPADAVACRYGGDEFAVAIPNCGRTLARTYAEELRGAVHALAPVLAGRSFAAGTLSSASASHVWTATVGRHPTHPRAAARTFQVRVTTRALEQGCLASPPTLCTSPSNRAAIASARSHPLPDVSPANREAELIHSSFPLKASSVQSV
jgi:diguanylate cyclase (GGDEF)-like protein